MRRRLVRIGLVVFVGAWAIALVYSVTAGGKSPERLDDATARAVERQCVTAEHRLIALGTVGDREPIAAQEARVTAENQIFATMVHRLRQLHPSSKTPAAALTGWLNDWQRMVTAREYYARDLRTKGADAVFREPGIGIEAIPNKMNNWPLEQGTRTDTCNTGVLQLEVIEGPRDYGPKSKS